ncbi:hypothetical protein [Gallaecimonas mangrovi]|uniref:hypothetical protein n=1 Tax=Gallaecimonas mangrovi TaxID=2291597 RepID=UPI000E20C622|nr:hypothetical protein [Gallaecimonas mangrovi]
MSESEEPKAGAFDAESLKALAAEHWHWLGDWLDLAQTEGQLVISSAVKMLAFGAAVALMAATGWLLLLGAFAVAIWQLGMPLPWVLLISAFTCIGSGWLLWRAACYQARQLRFDKSLKALGLKSSKS